MRAATCIGAFVLSLSLGTMMVGCGGDDETPVDPAADTGAVDSTAPDTNPPEDTGMPGDTGVADGMDGGDTGPLDFAEFVKGLIKTETTSKSAPTTVDDKTFVDKRDQAQFSELFP